MSRKLMVRVPPSEFQITPETKIQWVCYEQGLTTHAVSTTLGNLKSSLDSQNASFDEHLILLSGRLVSHQYKQVSKAQIKHLDKALPFLMEDELTEEVSCFHFASAVPTEPLRSSVESGAYKNTGSSSSTPSLTSQYLAVSAIKHTDMKALLHYLDDQTLSPDQILTEAEIPMTHGSSINVLLEKDSVLLSVSGEAGLSLDAAAVGFALAHLQNSQPELSKLPVILQ